MFTSTSTPSRGPRDLAGELDLATRALTDAREHGDPAAEAMARCRIHHAARALGSERGSWWTDA